MMSRRELCISTIISLRVYTSVQLSYSRIGNYFQQQRQQYTLLLKVATKNSYKSPACYYNESSTCLIMVYSYVAYARF